MDTQLAMLFTGGFFGIIGSWAFRELGKLTTYGEAYKKGKIDGMASFKDHPKFNFMERDLYESSLQNHLNTLKLKIEIAKAEHEASFLNLIPKKESNTNNTA